MVLVLESSEPDAKDCGGRLFVSTSFAKRPSVTPWAGYGSRE